MKRNVPRMRFWRASVRTFGLQSPLASRLALDLQRRFHLLRSWHGFPELFLLKSQQSIASGPAAARYFNKVINIINIFFRPVLRMSVVVSAAARMRSKKSERTADASSGATLRTAVRGGRVILRSTVFKAVQSAHLVARTAVFANARFATVVRSAGDSAVVLSADWQRSGPQSAGRLRRRISGARPDARATMPGRIFPGASSLTHSIPALKATASKAKAGKVTAVTPSALSSTASASAASAASTSAASTSAASTSAASTSAASTSAEAARARAASESIAPIQATAHAAELARDGLLAPAAPLTHPVSATFASVRVDAPGGRGAGSHEESLEPARRPLDASSEIAPPPSTAADSLPAPPRFVRARTLESAAAALLHSQIQTQAPDRPIRGRSIVLRSPGESAAVVRTVTSAQLRDRSASVSAARFLSFLKADGVSGASGARTVPSAQGLTARSSFHVLLRDRLSAMKFGGVLRRVTPHIVEFRRGLHLPQESLRTRPGSPAAPAPQGSPSVRTRAFSERTSSAWRTTRLEYATLSERAASPAVGPEQTPPAAFATQERLVHQITTHLERNASGDSGTVFPAPAGWTRRQADQLADQIFAKLLRRIELERYRKGGRQ